MIVWLLGSFCLCPDDVRRFKLQDIVRQQNLLKKCFSKLVKSHRRSTLDASSVFQSRQNQSKRVNKRSSQKPFRSLFAVTSKVQFLHQNFIETGQNSIFRPQDFDHCPNQQAAIKSKFLKTTITVAVCRCQQNFTKKNVKSPVFAPKSGFTSFQNSSKLNKSRRNSSEAVGTRQKFFKNFRQDLPKAVRSQKFVFRPQETSNGPARRHPDFTKNCSSKVVKTH